MIFGLFLFSCGGDVDAKKEVEIRVASADLSLEREQVQELRHDTACIQVFLSDMKMQQQKPIEDWKQPSFEEYEATDCAQTMRPVR